MFGDVNKLDEDWTEISQIFLYGCGRVAELCWPIIQKTGLKIAGVIDSNEEKRGTLWHDSIPIISFQEALKNEENTKIVVLTGHTAYNEIYYELVKNGLKEYKDFCRGGQFISEWMWKVKGLNCLYHVDVTITSRCTLKCKNCNMFIPYYSTHEDYKLEDIEIWFTLLFERIDYIAYIGLIGGETFLSPVLGEIISFIENNYKEKFGTLFFTTNGTVVPDDEVLKVISKYGVHISISDYSKELKYEDRLAKLCRKLDDARVKYEVLPVLVWTDFGFPPQRIRRSSKEVDNHLASCRPEWNALNDGKFYYCNCSWSAEKSGHFKLMEDDFIDLKKINPSDRNACHDIIRLSCGYSSFCKICGGCGKDNTNYVRVGEQIK